MRMRRGLLDEIRRHDGWTMHVRGNIGWRKMWMHVRSEVVVMGWGSHRDINRATSRHFVRDTRLIESNTRREGSIIGRRICRRRMCR